MSSSAAQPRARDFVFGRNGACPAFARVAFVLNALCAASTSVHAQNLVPNPNFNTTLAPWTQFLSSAPDPDGAGGPPVRVASPDLNASPSSGSALIDIDTTTAAPNAASGIAQCFDFPAPTAVNFVNYGMNFLIPSTTTTDGSLNVTVEIRLFSGTGCTGFLSGGSQGRVLAAGLASDSNWYVASDASFVPNGAPATAASAQIRGYLRQTGTAPTQTDYKVNLDHFFLVLNSTTPVRLLNFDVE